MNSAKKTRLYLFIGSVLTIVLVAAFLIILNINEPKEYTAVPFNVLIILTVIACIALAAFYAKGPVFNIYGELESANINAMLLTLLIIIQVSFFFEIISVRNQTLNYQTYSNIRRDISIAEQCDEEHLNDKLSELQVDGIAEISVVDADGTVLYSSDESKVGQKMADTVYSYVFRQDKEIRFVVDKSFVNDQLRAIILNLLTVLVTSMFFSVEMVLMMIRVISRRLVQVAVSSAYIDNRVETNDKMLTSLYYIRQIAFIFYFSSRLSGAFIPTMAKSLMNPFPGMSDAAAAGLPQSAETLLTCAAIFLTTLLLEKKGWKLPFIAGLLLVAAGTFASAVSVNLVMFILARAIVGLGYGFCWMTLRNLSLFTKDDRERLLGFALLNAGLYAGMNCGSSLGAILADIFGYKTVFMISAVMTVLTSLFIISMENAIMPRTEPKPEKKDDPDQVRMNVGQAVLAVLFVLLMIAPASIAASYKNYYLPLYFEDIGRSVTEVGRAQLLYDIVIVYAGPFLSVLIARFKGKALKNLNFVYNILISVSLFLPGLGAGLLLPFLGAALLGTADSVGFGVQNNYFLSLPAIKKLGDSKSLSVLSFIKKILEMTGPFVFASVIILGYQAGIRALAIAFAIMAVVFMASSIVIGGSVKRKESY